MSILPSPIPHPLDYCPFDVPGWAYEALEWVVGFDWPDGNERATWDVADQWYAITGVLGNARTESGDAATQVAGAYTGVGGAAFGEAWTRLAGTPDSPLEILLQATDELARLVDGGGADIEAAKLEAWIEIGLFLTELIGMTVAVALTLGAASPAAGGLIAATRLAIQQIFKRLVEQMGRKAIKQTVKAAGQRAVKQLTSREGLKHLGREALDEGFDETREELATNGGIQAYQAQGSRVDGVDLGQLGRAGLGGFAGGFAASGAYAGGRHGVTRGAAAEVFGEVGGSAVNGGLPDPESLAKAASSGGAGSALSSGVSSSLLDKTGKLASLLGEPGSVLPQSPGVASPSPSPADPSPDLPSIPSASPSAPSSPTLSPAASPEPSPGSPPAVSPALSPLPASPASSPSPASPSPSSPSPASPSAPSPTLSPDPSPASSTASPVEPSRALPADLSSRPTVDAPSPAASSHEPSHGLPVDTTPAPSPPPVAPSSLSSAPVTSSAPDLSVLDTSSATTAGATSSFVAAPGAASVVGGFGALSPGLDPPAPGTGRHVRAPRHRASSVPRHRDLGRPAQAGPTGPQPPGRSEIDSYVRFAREQRAAYAQFRKRDTIERLEEKARAERARARRARRSAFVARAFRLNPALADSHAALVAEATAIADRAEGEARILRDPGYSPDEGATITVDPQDWHLANRDGGRLAPGPVSLGPVSMLTGTDDPPSIVGTRRYGEFGGLRPPLAQHQLDLEQALPRHPSGAPLRAADPRSAYFQLLNDGGPAADPTRGINCQDCVLSFFDTYVHGRPRVSAPRTFDAYKDGDPQRPLYGESNGPERVEQATGGRLQSLCRADKIQDDPVRAQQQVADALGQVAEHLRTGGHGSFAFLMNLWESGSSHAWAAVNHHGEILFVDPQSGLVATPGTSLYGHRGVADPANLVALDALVVDAQGRPLPFPGKPDGWWHPRTTPPPPQTPHTPAAPAPHAPAASAPAAPASAPEPPNVAAITSDDVDVRALEDRLLQSLDESHRDQLDTSVRKATKIARRLRPDLDVVTSALGGAVELAGTDHSVKSARSLARAYATEQGPERPGLDHFLRTTKDRVRFAIKLPEQGYANTVEGAIDVLRRLNHRTTRLVNFWQGNGRHNGLNATVVDASDFGFEVQFPTALSWAASERTHQAYEVLRLPTAAYAAHVDAFLRIVAVNKELDLVAHQPDKLHRLAITKTVNSTFASWVAARPAAWRAYLRALSDNDVTFDDILARHALTRADVLPSETPKGEDDHDGIRLPDNHQGGRNRGGDQRDRLRDPGDPAAASRSVERSAPGVDLRPGSGGSLPLRPGLPGQEPADRPRDGGGDSPPHPADAPTKRGNPDGDVRGGGKERLGLGPAGEPDHGPGELIKTHNGTIRANTRLGQTRGSLGAAFEIGAHYLDTYDHIKEVKSALLLGRRYDVRALRTAHGRRDGRGNPDFLVRVDPADEGSFGDFKRLDPPDPQEAEQSKLSRGVSKQLRLALAQDARMHVAVVDGRDAGLGTIDAVRGIRRALGVWALAGRPVRPEDRMIVFTANDQWVIWRGDTGEISVST
ncbi:toxin glutamine deamidase domain-containing protein [Symbioplanes lichenis]|uniref:toxin glutamine deamidase domain-containing protein n=1 Tax=Symbioplanes lichenis TaxID=1629072 RepID=UPI002738A892|nr:toxin glutamine deamidase domain-containing protein [Actinoplanes lichenis]